MDASSSTASNISSTARRVVTYRRIMLTLLLLSSTVHAQQLSYTEVDDGCIAERNITERNNKKSNPAGGPCSTEHCTSETHEVGLQGSALWPEEGHNNAQKPFQ